ncbi:hypothetical protein [Brevibacillus sp. MER 51]|uniref:hypothetical protein n=1 Tax=Brevibacillus sp. MER 51 TaxID=2939560 RepID=UPI002041CFB9|nr:hypothetical protein [Brevibacillus sp. MER 51]MCM3145354.1 hypothetical protein [Brevibacillus sp. MER 51]
METIFQEAATTILELSKGVGVDVTTFIIPDKGFSIVEWWEAVVSCMTLAELEVYIVSAPQGSSNSDLVPNLKNIAIKQRDLLRQDQEKEWSFMHNPSIVLTDFNTFIALMDKVCEELGLKRLDYSTPEELFQAVLGRYSVKYLSNLDEMMGEDYLRDDLLGIMHRAVRARIEESRRSA